MLTISRPVQSDDPKTAPPYSSISGSVDFGRPFPGTVGKSIQPGHPRAGLAAAERTARTGRKTPETGQLAVTVGTIEDDQFGSRIAHVDPQLDGRKCFLCPMHPGDTSECKLHFLHNYHSYEAWSMTTLGGTPTGCESCDQTKR
jgi:hypothetical protein